jgi:tetratricopeptide (TPR) repeat protein
VGPGHRDTAEALNNVASVLYRLNQLAKAKGAYERALVVKLAVYGEGSASVADTLYNLSLLVRDMHEQGVVDSNGAAARLDEAVGYALRALEASETANGAADPRTEDARRHVADLEKRQADAATAAEVAAIQTAASGRSFRSSFGRKR